MSALTDEQMVEEAEVDVLERDPNRHPSRYRPRIPGAAIRDYERFRAGRAREQVARRHQRVQL